MPISTPDSSVVNYGGDTNHFTHVLEHIFIPALTNAGFEAISPISEGADLIQAAIIERLVESDFVLCDMSILNPNVFFELGIRTALNKPICLIKDDITTNVPFDTNVINHHTYRSALNPWDIPTDVDNLTSHIKETETRSGNENNMWKYFGLSTTAHALAESQPGDELKYLTIQMEAMRKQMTEISSSIPTTTKPSLKPSFDLQSVFKFAKDIGVKPTGGLQVDKNGNENEYIMYVEEDSLTDDTKENIIKFAVDAGVILTIELKKV